MSWSALKMGLLKHIIQNKLSFSQLRVFHKLHKQNTEVSWRGCHSRWTRGQDELTQTSAYSDKKIPHIPVMLTEVLGILKPKNGQVIVDMTFGGGGHTREIIHQAPNARMLALDRDPLAHSIASELAQCSKGQITPLLGRFSDLPELLITHGIEEDSVDSFLFDLGASSMQFDEAERGFSLSQDGPLDMRMDGGRIKDQPSAADVVNNLDEADLYHIIKKYGEEKLARKIAHMIVETRYAFGNITRTQQLADIVSSVFESDHKQDKLMRHSHVATKTFQALRIFVNNELNELNNGLEVAHRYLKPGGVCVVLAFHSLEDRIVKRHFHSIDMDAKLNMNVRDHHRNPSVIHDQSVVSEILQQRWRPLSKKVTVPTMTDIVDNPRARSAKLRAAFKL